jgi:acylphosphatase
MIRNLSIRVSGRVQGVYFRASTLEIARELHVNGSVRNEKDGSVFIEAEGTPEALAQFTAWCSHGPAGAKVETIQTSEGTLKGYHAFEILR